MQTKDDSFALKRQDSSITTEEWVKSSADNSVLSIPKDAALDSSSSQIIHTEKEGVFV